MKAKVKKKTTKLIKKKIKEESEKHLFFGYHKVPPNYPPTSSQYSSSQFQYVHLGNPPYFDGTDYPKWGYDMKMHFYGLHPSIWEVVVVSVTSPKNGIPTAEQAQDYFRNAQAIRVITGSLCAQEFNKVRSVEIAKVIWDTLKEVHEGTDQVREGKMDLIHGELEHFMILEEEIVTQIFDRLMLLVSDIRTLRRRIGMITRRDPSFKTKTPNQLLEEVQGQEQKLQEEISRSSSCWSRMGF
uniref:DUF4219 domain-containing protein n=1 Tax=Setaria italica TaxID=4555 RepID=K3Y1N6_SETIT